MARPSVLIADCDENVREHLTRGLDDEFDVELVATSSEALDRLHEERFAVVVLDWIPNEMACADVVHFLGVHAPETRLVLSFGPGAVDTAHQLRADGYLIKPYSVRILKERLDALRFPPLGSTNAA